MTATACIECPLRQLPLFLPHTPEELALVQFVKRREQTLKAGDTLIHEGQADTRLFTLLEGWAYRFKTLESLSLPRNRITAQGRGLSHNRLSIRQRHCNGSTWGPPNAVGRRDRCQPMACFYRNPPVILPS